MKQLYTSILFSIVFLLFLNSGAFAGVEPYENFIKGKIKRNDTLLVKDEKFKNTKYNWNDIADVSVKNTIALRLTDQNVIKNNFNCEVRLKVEYLTDPNQVTPEVKNITLKVNFSAEKGADYKYIDRYDFSGAYWVRVIVDNIYSKEYGNNVPPFFLLTNSIIINRRYKFKPSTKIKPSAIVIKTKSNIKKSASALNYLARTTSAVNAFATGALSNNGNQLQLTWGVITGAEEYDIEWTTVDSGNRYIDTVQQMANGTAGVLDAVTLDKIFLHNSTRVTVPGQSYTISMVSNDDFMLVRMRQAQYTADGIRITGDWNYTQDDGSYAVWPIPWHQPTLNWQYEGNFAEEGKKKEVMQYFDGTLRNRQTVTINNSDQINVVQENIYDEFGRATASILPAPIKENPKTEPYLHYFNNFNLNNDNVPYNSDNVAGTTPSASCEFNPDPLSTTSGASQYYSSQNPFLRDRSYNSFIPDALGFPISVKQYTHDNTGRLALQGGVGKALQPGQSFPSSTTKYYYGKPEQWELDKIFGNDVGFASHYLKNMVVDPNGQASISYVNGSGKTIATALAGPAPATMDTVKSYVRPTIQKINILDSSKFVFDNSALNITATTTYLASLSGPAAITYTIQKLVDKFPGGADSICSNCYYDLNIKVVNDCNSIIYNNTTPIQVGSKIGNCDSTGIKSDSLNVNFPQIGEYYITFQLSFSKTIMENYVDQFVQQGTANGYLRKEFSFILPYLDGLDYKACLSDCSTCEQTLGMKTNFIQVFSKELASLDVDSASIADTVFQTWVSNKYDYLKSYCDSLSATCFTNASTTTPCDEYETVMKMDVSPGGQYALFDANGTPLDPLINVISNNWRTVFPVLPSDSARYQAERITLPDGSITSPYSATFTLAMLVQYWKTDWAGYFLKYHPEYCKLQFCMINNTSENWDELVQQTILTNSAIPSIPRATTGFHYDYNNGSWLAAADPFFKPGGLGASYAAGFISDLNNYSTNILHNNGSSVKNLSQFIDYSLYCSDPSAAINSTPDPLNNWDSCTPTAACRVLDKEWAAYSEAYFQLKEIYYGKVRDAYCNGQPIVGTPYQLPSGSPCPVNTDFSINTLSSQDGTPTVTCDASHQTLTISYVPGKVTTSVTINLSYAAGVDTMGLPAFFQFAPGDSSKMFCLPSEVPAQAVYISSIICAGCEVNPLLFNTWTNGYVVQNVYNASGSIVSTKTINPNSQSYFDGTLKINPGNTYDVINSFHSYSGNWSMDNNCQFGLYSNNIKYTAYAVSGTQLSLGHRENNVEEIWHFTGVPNGAVTGTCANPTVINVTSTLSASTYLTGNYPNRSQLTIIPGSAGTTPVFSCSNTLTPQSAFYNCLSISAPDTTINFQNVWVFSCVYDNGSASPTSPYLTKTSRFDLMDTTMVIPDVTTVTQQNNAALSGQIASSCDAGADGWITALTPGLSAYSSATIQSLRAALVDVCSKGGDMYHPFGASTIAPGVTTSSYSSFGAAIKGVLGLGNFTSQLNPWLISAPYPFTPKEQSTPPVIGASSVDICNELSLYQQQCDQYNTSHGTSLSVYNYLAQQYGTAMTISEADFQVLQTSCGQCRFILAHDITLPVFMDPSSKGCTSAAEFATAKSDLQAQFGGTGLSINDPNYQTIFTNFMNQRWGFMLTFDNYTDYQALLGSNAGATLCNVPPYTTVTVDPLACIEGQIAVAVANGKSDYQTYLITEENIFRQSYISTCSAAKENVDLYAPQQIYHYTLYYYDQADNLVRTVPPEGVAFLNDGQISAVQTYRNAYAVADTLDTFNASMVSQDTAAALNTLSARLDPSSHATKAMEMWTYNPDNTNNQVIASTPDHQYIFQTCITGNILNIDAYALDSSTTDTLTILQSKHFHADISAMLPLPPWQNTVLQYQGFLNSLSVYVNGTRVRGDIDTIASGCGPAIIDTLTPAIYPFSWNTLKQLRFYNRAMTTQEISANAANPYFLPSNQSAMSWYRFNVPPAGSPTTIDAGNNAEFRYLPVYPNHRMPTSYEYNATNQVNEQQSPDGGVNRYWYDLLSRLVISQNDKQLPDSNYSYTVFDSLGRITEVGQKSLKLTRNYGGKLIDIIPGNQTSINLGPPDYIDSLTNTNFLNAGSNTEITNTYYDAPARDDRGIQQLPQYNLRKRVAATTYRATERDPITQATYYNYDLDGNVSNLYQQIDGLGTKKIDYEYDLISGKVNFVSYQDGQPDQFYYNYVYDADNRLTEAWSSITANVSSYGRGSTLDETDKRMDASYQYYLHGPLARVELGDVNGKVQGMDYAYTLQGWLKGVNSSNAQPGFDMGGDGYTNNPTIATDAIGYSLNYFKQDYQQINTGVTNPFYDVGSSIDTAKSRDNPQPYHPLYNGNISASTVMINAPSAEALNTSAQMFYSYQYDQLNRLTYKPAYNIQKNALQWTPELNEQFSYDGNGNIETLIRNSSNLEPSRDINMDNQTFGYNLDGNGNKINNKLDHIADTETASNDPFDIDDQQAGNYTYDAIGNLIADQQSQISNITWTVYGKIKNIFKADLQTINYSYNTANNRVNKTANNVQTWYVRDAQGNTLAVYDNSSGSINRTEQTLYGSSRIGIWNSSASGKEGYVFSWNNAGNKKYELNDHLGSVLATITDSRLANGNDTLPATSYNPNVNSAQYYYAFGMIEPYRQLRDGNYRYGFNGKENDNDVKGVGNQIDYGERIYDPRVGKFLSVDPLYKQYPELSTYQYASNSPIANIDRDGLEAMDPYATNLAQYLILSKAKSPQAQKAVLKSQMQVMQGQIEVGGTLMTVFAPESGNINKFILGSVFLSALHDNRAKTPEGRLEQDKQSRQSLANAGLLYLSGKLLEAVTSRIPFVNNGSLLIEADGNFSSSEIRAAIYMKEQGNDVLLRMPKGTRAEGNTSDLLVNQKFNYDVYTPTTGNVSRMVKAIADKNDQATGIIVDLSESTATKSDLKNILARVRGTGATNIKDIQVIDSKPPTTNAGN